MPIEVAWKGTHLHVQFSGTVTKADLRSFVDRMAAIEAEVTPTPDRLVDISDTTAVGLGFAEIAALVEVRRAIQPRNPFRTALVAVTALQQGYARMFQNLNDHPLVTIRVFDSLREAEAWIDTPPSRR